MKHGLIPAFDAFLLLLLLLLLLLFLVPKLQLGNAIVSEALFPIAA